MAERLRDRCLGAAFLLVNSYEGRPNNLRPLVRIDEAIKDFWVTFRSLRFWPVVYIQLEPNEGTAHRHAQAHVSTVIGASH